MGFYFYCKIFKILVLEEENKNKVVLLRLYYGKKFTCDDLLRCQSKYLFRFFGLFNYIEYGFFKQVILYVLVNKILYIFSYKYLIKI